MSHRRRKRRADWPVAAAELEAHGTAPPGAAFFGSERALCGIELTDVGAAEIRTSGSSWRSRQISPAATCCQAAADRRPASILRDRGASAQFDFVCPLETLSAICLAMTTKFDVVPSSMGRRMSHSGDLPCNT
jgi:hypothetical protein